MVVYLVESRVFQLFGRPFGPSKRRSEEGVSIVLIGGVSLAIRGVNAEVALKNCDRTNVSNFTLSITERPSRRDLASPNSDLKSG